MIKETWIPLTDYSSKYRVSVSTLRRRIKAEDIRYRFQDGKYFLLDTPMGAHPREHRPSQTSDASLMGTHAEASAKKEVTEAFLNKGQSVFNNSADEPILTAANRLLNELKKAYTLVLQEKEEQILQLKAELSDLKTLVKVLEHENDRLNPNRQSFFR
jgi:hypothetical protein